ncbi:MAG: DUF433 domain-containing protein [Microcystis novacekii Mn_MB_F_20050700_S1D]|uniref:DUF433 domain-containing protein n=1 Tax=Microcystis novacekii Mn_MB_F_20050700_S1D TaxID=2486266 RepID=A0A552IWF9_9CHRO|nr:MAG: DUF433 domain-containing protein [Microcystis novacekii Mn_MB_F_20050700_S1D]
MTWTANRQTQIIRTERGLTITGTRTSLYEVIDFLKADYPSKLIRDILNLTDAQINAALSYIEANQAEIEAEYQEVLQTREEIRQYWEERNREHFTRIAQTPHKPGQEAFWARLEEHRAKRITQQQ